jgi:hypothetical protein
MSSYLLLLVWQVPSPCFFVHCSLPPAFSSLPHHPFFCTSLFTIVTSPSFLRRHFFAVISSPSFLRRHFFAVSFFLVLLLQSLLSLLPRHFLSTTFSPARLLQRVFSKASPPSRLPYHVSATNASSSPSPPTTDQESCKARNRTASPNL